MTINQAIDQLTQGQKLNEEQRELRLSLINVKVEFGGKTLIENSQQVKNIIEHGNKEGSL
jgi:hypothetical protein